MFPPHCRYSFRPVNVYTLGVVDPEAMVISRVCSCSTSSCQVNSPRSVRSVGSGLQVTTRIDLRSDELDIVGECRVFEPGVIGKWSRGVTWRGR